MVCLESLLTALSSCVWVCVGWEDGERTRGGGCCWSLNLCLMGHTSFVRTASVSWTLKCGKRGTTAAPTFHTARKGACDWDVASGRQVSQLWACVCECVCVFRRGRAHWTVMAVCLSESESCLMCEHVLGVWRRLHWELLSCPKPLGRRRGANVRPAGVRAARSTLTAGQLWRQRLTPPPFQWRWANGEHLEESFVTHVI